MSHASFHGNLGADPVVRNTAGGTSRVTFSVAVTTGSKDKGNEKTHWVPVTAFGSLADNVAQTFKKGMHVFVSGRFDSYKQSVVIDGQEKEIDRLGIIADQCGPDLRFASANVTRNERNGNGGGYNGGGQAAPQQQAAPQPVGAGVGGSSSVDEF